MIRINNIELEKKYFPDGSQMLLDVSWGKFNIRDGWATNIFWQYEGDEEYMTLYYIVKHIRDNFGRNTIINLQMPYVPNARMDRVKSKSEVFTLKHSADFINSMNFNAVSVLDCHSNVSASLFDCLTKMDETIGIKRVLYKISSVNDIKPVIYFPDDGAMKRYKDIEALKGYKIIYGKKVRNWETGEILGLDVYDEKGEKMKEGEIKGETILMIDDIISYGGTLAYSADKLKECGAEKIYAYASHVENSVLNKEKGTLLKRLENGTVDKVYTTNSLYNGSHPKIEIIHTI